jgi:hypothetical protein
VTGGSWSGPGNEYVLRWVGADDLDDIGLRPRAVAALLRALLAADRDGRSGPAASGQR